MFGRKKAVTGNHDAADSAEHSGSAPATMGPHDRSSIGAVPQYYADLGFGHIDLGAMVIGVPAGRDLKAALGPKGQPEVPIVTTVSPGLPRGFAAPKSAGQWRTMVSEMGEQLEQQGAEVRVEDGPWGRELVAVMPGAVFRAIGVDGHRWTAEVRIMARPELADEAAEEGREVFGHLLVNRGDGPMPVREQLPLTIPDEIQQALTSAQSQLAAQQQAQAYQQQMAAGQVAQAPAQAPQPPAPNPDAGASAPPRSAPTPPSPEPTDAPATQPRRDGSAMDRLRTSDDL